VDCPTNEIHKIKCPTKKRFYSIPCMAILMSVCCMVVEACGGVGAVWQSVWAPQPAREGLLRPHLCHPRQWEGMNSMLLSVTRFDTRPELVLATTMHSSAKLQSIPLFAVILCSWNKFYHKHCVCFLLYLLGQIDSWLYYPNSLVYNNNNNNNINNDFI